MSVCVSAFCSATPETFALKFGKMFQNDDGKTTKEFWSPLDAQFLGYQIKRGVRGPGNHDKLKQRRNNTLTSPD